MIAFFSDTVFFGITSLSSTVSLATNDSDFTRKTKSHTKDVFVSQSLTHQPFSLHLETFLMQHLELRIFTEEKREEKKKKKNHGKNIVI